MANLTEAERKWLESLKRCLNKKPASLEILVHEMSNSNAGCQSQIHLMRRGVIAESQRVSDDLMPYKITPWLLSLLMTLQLTITATSR